jgi:hypothetical protein
MYFLTSVKHYPHGRFPVIFPEKPDGMLFSIPSYLLSRHEVKTDI